MILKKIENGNCEVNYGNSIGSILFDITSNKVYYLGGSNYYHTNEIYVYNNYDNFKLKKLDIKINISTKISSCYSVIYKGFFSVLNQKIRV